MQSLFRKMNFWMLFLMRMTIIKKQIEWQHEIQKEVEQKEKIVEEFDWNLWEKRAEEFLTYDRLKSSFQVKQERSIEDLIKLKMNLSLYITMKLKLIIYKKLSIEYAFDSVFK